MRAEPTARAENGRDPERQLRRSTWLPNWAPQFATSEIVRGTRHNAPGRGGNLARRPDLVTFVIEKVQIRKVLRSWSRASSPLRGSPARAREITKSEDGALALIARPKLRAQIDPMRVL